MANTYKKLAQAELTGGNDTLYTVPGSTETIVSHIRIVNTDSSDRTVKLWHDGTTDPYVILPSATVLAGGWAEFDGTILMEAADTLVALGSAASALTVTVYGTEIA